MKSRRPLHIVLAVLAIVSAAVLFVTYGKTLPMGPFDTVRLEQPTVVDSDGEYTAVVLSESRRALVLNSSGDLTGIINCETLDSPIDAITDVCISNGLVYASGIVFEPDSDLIQFERVIAYNVNGSIKRHRARRAFCIFCDDGHKVVGQCLRRHRVCIREDKLCELR